MTIEVPDNMADTIVTNMNAGVFSSAAALQTALTTGYTSGGITATVESIAQAPAKIPH